MGLSADSVREEFLRRAIELSAEKMREDAGGPFGAVVARAGEFVAEGWNQVTSICDPTAHAEVVAIRRAAAEIGSFDLSGCTIYSSCEPCPMCLGAIYWARLDGVVFANTRHQAAEIGFDDAHFHDQLSLPLDRQTLPSLHLPSPDAARIFDEWKARVDKTHY